MLASSIFGLRHHGIVKSTIFGHVVQMQVVTIQTSKPYFWKSVRMVCSACLTHMSKKSYGEMKF